MNDRPLKFIVSNAKDQLRPFSSFLRYCKDIANLPLYVLWAFLAMATKKRYELVENVMSIFMQKIKFIPYLLLKYY